MERALEALNKVGLAERSHHKPNELSGGQILLELVEQSEVVTIRDTLEVTHTELMNHSQHQLMSNHRTTQLNFT